MHNPQHSVYRIRIARLAYPATPRCRIPLRQKISTFKRPPAEAMLHGHVGFGVAEARLHELYVELYLGLIRGPIGAADVSSITVLQQAEKTWIGRIHAHSQPPDFDND